MQVLGIINEKAQTPQQLNYNKYYIGLSDGITIQKVHKRFKCQEEVPKSGHSWWLERRTISAIRGGRA